MIFVTIGSAPHDFKRLLQQMDWIAEKTGRDVVMQTGLSAYRPIHAKSFDFVSYDEVMGYFKQAEVIVSHASAGPILYARKFNKPLILVPRRGHLKEHIDDHQMETATALKGSSSMIEIVNDVSLLEAAITRAVEKSQQRMMFESPVSLVELSHYIQDYINSIASGRERTK